MCYCRIHPAGQAFEHTQGIQRFYPHSADTTWQITAGCHRLAAFADAELQVILVAARDDALLVTKYILNESGETWI